MTGQNICLHGVLCSIPFNLTCNMTTSRKNVLTFRPPQGVGQNMCLYGALCSIPIYSICNMTTFRKKTIFKTLTQPRGRVCGCKVRMHACILLHSLFLFFDIQHGYILKQLNFDLLTLPSTSKNQYLSAKHVSTTPEY